MSSHCWAVLYTKQLTKKQKKWFDGFLLLRNNTAARLLDDEGKAIASAARLFSKTVEDALQEDGRLTVFEGFLVEVQNACAETDVPGTAGMSAAVPCTNAEAAGPTTGSTAAIGGMVPGSEGSMGNPWDKRASGGLPSITRRNRGQLLPRPATQQAPVHVPAQPAVRPGVATQTTAAKLGAASRAQTPAPRSDAEILAMLGLLSDGPCDASAAAQQPLQGQVTGRPPLARAVGARASIKRQPGYLSHMGQENEDPIRRGVGTCKAPGGHLPQSKAVSTPEHVNSAAGRTTQGAWGSAPQGDGWAMQPPGLNGPGLSSWAQRPPVGTVGPLHGSLLDAAELEGMDSGDEEAAVLPGPNVLWQHVRCTKSGLPAPGCPQVPGFGTATTQAATTWGRNSDTRSGLGGGESKQPGMQLPCSGSSGGGAVGQAQVGPTAGLHLAVRGEPMHASRLGGWSTFLEDDVGDQGTRARVSLAPGAQPIPASRQGADGGGGGSLAPQGLEELECGPAWAAKVGCPAGSSGGRHTHGAEEGGDGDGAGEGGGGGPLISAGFGGAPWDLDGTAAHIALAGVAGARHREARARAEEEWQGQGHNDETVPTASGMLGGWFGCCKEQVVASAELEPEPQWVPEQATGQPSSSHPGGRQGWAAALQEEPDGAWGWGAAMGREPEGSGGWGRPRDRGSMAMGRLGAAAAVSGGMPGGAVSAWGAKSAAGAAGVQRPDSGIPAAGATPGAPGASSWGARMDRRAPGGSVFRVPRPAAPNPDSTLLASTSSAAGTGQASRGTQGKLHGSIGVTSGPGLAGAQPCQAGDTPPGLQGLRFPQLQSSAVAPALSVGTRAGASVMPAPAGQADNRVGMPVAPPPQQRRVSVAVSYCSVSQYLSRMYTAMVEEVNLGLAASAQPFHTALLQVLREQQQQQGQHAPAPGDSSGAGGPGAHQGFRNQGSGWGAGAKGLGGGAGKKVGAALAAPGVSGVSAALERLCVLRHVPYFSHCDLVVRKPYKPWVPAKGGGWRGGKKARGGGRQGQGRGEAEDGEDGEGSEGGGAQREEGPSFYLVVKPPGKSRLKNCRRHDLWLVGSSPTLQDPSCTPSATPSSGGGPPWLALCRSLWHGPDRDGKFAVEWLTGAPQQLLRGGGTYPVYALRGPDVQTEVQLIEGLATLLGHRGPAGNPLTGAGQARLQAQLLPPLLSYLVNFQPTGHTAAAVAPSLHGKRGRAPGKRQRGGAVAGGAAGAGAEASPLGPGAGKEGMDSGSKVDVSSVVQRYLQDFDLNADQAAVMWHAASWFRQGTQEPAGTSPTHRQSIEAGGSSALGPQGGSSPGGVDADGTSVVCRTPAWAGKVQPPVCLVHGPFGSGKSTLLVAVIMMVTELAASLLGPSASFRTLVAAHTNVAVDRVLLGLKERGFDSFIRVGSLRRIARPIIGHSLHQAEDGAGRQDTVSVLKEMIGEAASPDAAAALKVELEAVQKGVHRQRKRLLLSSPVVGTTCCTLLRTDASDKSGNLTDPALSGDGTAAAGLANALGGGASSGFAGGRFSLLVLDECSQLVEPLSLAAVTRSGAAFLVAAGDPCQLPPVIASPAHVTPAPGSGHQPSTSAAQGLAKRPGQGQGQGQGPQGPDRGPGGDQGRAGGQEEGPAQGLLRPMFVRLAQLGYPVHLLRYQYRCHPQLSAIPNASFYGGRLLNGCTPEGRAPLLFAPPRATPQAQPPPPQPPGPCLPGSALTLEERAATLGGTSSGMDGQGSGDGDGDSSSGPAIGAPRGLPALLFCELRGGQCQQATNSRSSSNAAEGRLVAQLVQRCVSALSRSGHTTADIGVICFYRAQVAAIQEELLALQRQLQGSVVSGGGDMGPAGEGQAGEPWRPRQEGGGSGDEGKCKEGETVRDGASRRSASGLCQVQVATIDSFQGAEKEVIILATTITRAAQFVADPQRLNVALTRARRHLIVVGSSLALDATSPVFRALLRNCRQTPGAYYASGAGLVGTLDAGDAAREAMDEEERGCGGKRKRRAKREGEGGRRRGKGRRGVLEYLDIEADEEEESEEEEEEGEEGEEEEGEEEGDRASGGRGRHSWAEEEKEWEKGFDAMLSGGRLLQGAEKSAQGIAKTGVPMLVELEAEEGGLYEKGGSGWQGEGLRAKGALRQERKVLMDLEDAEEADGRGQQTGGGYGVTEQAARLAKGRTGRGAQVVEEDEEDEDGEEGKQTWVMRAERGDRGGVGMCDDKWQGMGNMQGTGMRLVRQGEGLVEGRGNGRWVGEEGAVSPGARGRGAGVDWGGAVDGEGMMQVQAGELEDDMGAEGKGGGSGAGAGGGAAGRPGQRRAVAWSDEDEEGQQPASGQDGSGPAWDQKREGQAPEGGQAAQDVQGQGAQGSGGRGGGMACWGQGDAPAVAGQAAPVWLICQGGGGSGGGGLGTTWGAGPVMEDSDADESD